jgi:nickel-type superoxide dismutase maturation protease
MEVAWTHRWVRRLEVTGESMMPTLQPGQRITAARPWRRIRVGDIVALRNPTRPDEWIVKRCCATTRDTVDLRGDNEENSTDSRDFGVVARRDVRWLVWESSLRSP